MALPSPVLQVLGRALQEVLNRTLALDVDASTRVRSLAGRTIELTWSTTGMGLRLGVDDAGSLTIGPRQGKDSADLGISGSLAGLLSMAGFARAPGAAVSRVDISGDAQLAREIETLVRGASPDLEAVMSARLGDTAGPVLARSLLGAWHWARASASDLRTDIAEYLVEESGDVVGEVELSAFHREVDALRDRVERLALQVDRLPRAGAP